jgi:hypothetical protein
MASYSIAPLKHCLRLGFCPGWLRRMPMNRFSAYHRRAVLRQLKRWLCSLFTSMPEDCPSSPLGQLGESRN